MRTLPEIDADLKALGRPLHPGVASVTKPSLITTWRAERAAWALMNPGGEERYALLIEEREATETERARQRWASARANSMALDVGVPELVRRALVDLERFAVIDAADSWLESDKTWLVIAGPVGTGKSVTAGYALEKMLHQQRRAAWVESSKVSTLAGGFGGEAQARRLESVDLLVVDDFGTEHLSPWAQSVFFEILSSRHENALRTILTTNLDKFALRARLGPRLADRVSNACRFVQCVGDSLRGAR